MTKVFVKRTMSFLLCTYVHTCGRVVCSSGTVRTCANGRVRVYKLAAHTLDWDRDQNSENTKHCYDSTHGSTYSVTRYVREENASLMNIKIRKPNPRLRNPAYTPGESKDSLDLILPFL